MATRLQLSDLLNSAYANDRHMPFTLSKVKPDEEDIPDDEGLGEDGVVLKADSSLLDLMTKSGFKKALKEEGGQPVCGCGEPMFRHVDGSWQCPACEQF